MQTEICNEVFSTLQGFGDLQNTHDSHRDSRAHAVSLSQDLSEEYLQARAVLSSFMSRTGSPRRPQPRPRPLRIVVKQDEDYAPAWSGLGITHLQYARHGLGGQMHVLEARRAFDKALQLDPGSVEANLYRVYMLLSRGEKESARHGIEHCSRPPPTTGTSTSSPASRCASTACTTKRSTSSTPRCASTPPTPPSSTTTVPASISIRTSWNSPATRSKKASPWNRASRCSASRSAISRCALGDLARAVETLESVISDEASLRIVFPTIALCYVQLGDREKAASFILEETLAAAEADGEMAYRLATYFAVDGDESEALHWLRRAIYLGNENYPWFTKNPAWRNLTGHSDFERILEDLKKSYRRNQKNWKRLLAQVRD